MSQLPPAPATHLPTHQTTERLALLKQRAQQVLDERAVGDASHQSPDSELGRVLEDLRIYQVELELQNQELREAQQEAELARRRYQLLFDQMPMVAMVVDRNGMVEECNACADGLLGKLRQKVSLDGRFWRKLSRIDRVRVHEALRSVASGETQVLPQMLMANNGDPTPVMDAHLIGLSMDYKLDRRVLILLVDRSEEVARRQDQQFYQDLLNSSDSFFYAADKQGQMLMANQAMLSFLGAESAAVLGQRREAFMPLRDAILHNESDQRVLRTGEPVTIEESMKLGQPEGASSFLTRKFALHDLSGRVYGVGGISTNITSIKEQQRLALLSEKVFMTSEEAIIITDAQCFIIRVNPAFERQCGFSSGRVLGRHTRMLKSGRQDADFYRAMWEGLETLGHWSGEFSNRRSDGSFYAVWSNVNVVRNEAGEVLHYIAVQTDLTQLHATQLRLEYQASYDALTGLPNRALFNERIGQLLAQSKRHGQTFALLFIDLDRFKEVNDTLGHQAGDELLRHIAQRLRDGVRAEDTVARMGGDEFVVLLAATNVEGAHSVANNLLQALRQPVTLEQLLNYRPMASVGLAVYPADGVTSDLLLRNADMAMYGAKVGGRNRLSIYTPAMTVANDHAFNIQNELAEAIGAGQLRVYYQPKCEMATGALVGAEALVRWERPGHGLVMPDAFIRIAEKAGLLVGLDQWVMNDALRQVGQWIRAGLWQSTWRLAVNQNVADLQSPDLVPRLRTLLQRHRVSAQALELEITEDALMQNTPAQLTQLDALRDMGVSLAIDDFGTGYSSLAYLRQMPVSVLKIDLRFVDGMLNNESDGVLVNTIVDMAHNLGLTVVAEGVETRDQQVRLTQLGCELGQGTLFGMAVSAADFSLRLLQPEMPRAVEGARGC